MPRDVEDGRGSFRHGPVLRRAATIKGFDFTAAIALSNAGSASAGFFLLIQRMPTFR